MLFFFYLKGQDMFEIKKIESFEAKVCKNWLFEKLPGVNGSCIAMKDSSGETTWRSKLTKVAIRLDKEKASLVTTLGMDTYYLGDSDMNKSDWIEDLKIEYPDIYKSLKHCLVLP